MINIVVAKGYLSIAKFIINNYYLSDINKIFAPTLDSEMSVLHFAALNNRSKTLQYLLSFQVSSLYLNKRNKNGLTPLACASSKNSLQCLQILLTMPNLNIFISDFHGNTPLSYAIFYNELECVTALIKYIFERIRNINTTSKELINNYYSEIHKYLALSITDNENYLQVDINSFDEESDVLLLNQFFSNVQNFKKIVETKKLIDFGKKLPSINIKVDNFQKGQGVLRQWIKDCFTITVKHNFFETFEGKLYLPHFDKITEQDKCNMSCIGFLVAIVLLYSPITLELSPIFFKILTNEEVTLKDILSDNTNNFFNKVPSYSDQEIDNMMLYFVESCGNKNYDLVPGGSLVQVTKSNFSDFLKKKWEFYFSGCRGELLKAFKEGFNVIVPEEYLKMFNSSDLMYLAIKKPQVIPVSRWKSYCKIVRPQQQEQNDDNTLEWFWKYVENLSSENHFKLVEFICGNNILPFNDLETLHNEHKPLTITFVNKKDEFPIAMTCSYTLQLPFYSSEKKLNEMFDIALENFGGFQFV